MNKSHLLFVILTLAVSFAISPAPVHADMSPPPEPGIGGLSTFKIQATNVQMTFERVEMEILDIPEGTDENGFRKSIPVAVNAWYVMHNQSNADEKMQVVFPLDDFNNCSTNPNLKIIPSYTRLSILRDSFKVNIGGIPAEVTDVTTDHPHKTEGVCDYLHWAAFDVSFPANRDVLVRVSYLMAYGGGEPDYIENLEYILETGAGWKGPITKGYIILRFPYIVEDNILPGTTSGYVKTYNELFWSFGNLEPTSDNNIFISYIEPMTWKTITDSRERIKRTPSDIKAWRQLADIYGGIARHDVGGIRSKVYEQKVFDTYRQAITINPNSSELYTGVAKYYWNYGYNMGPDKDGKLVQIFPKDTVIPFLERALQLDPYNKEALDLLQQLQASFGNFDFDFPPTLTPANTPTATITPSATITPLDTITATVTATNTTTPVPSLTPTRLITLITQSTKIVEKNSVSAPNGLAGTNEIQPKNPKVYLLGLVLIVTIPIVLLIAIRLNAARKYRI